MIKSVKIYHGYYILENNPTEVIRHINSSAIYDMIETNDKLINLILIKPIIFLKAIAGIY